MNLIFHEKQEGSLCAQHALNSLLQNQYFSPFDLAEYAKELDRQEFEHCNRGGNLDIARASGGQESENMDDSGMFSFQVIAKALALFSLEIINYESQHEAAVAARLDPAHCSAMTRAYICNHNAHWLTIRRFGSPSNPNSRWVNLNSTLRGPAIISDLYLQLFIDQLRREGYTVFLVIGILPDCAADSALEQNPDLKIQEVSDNNTAYIENGRDYQNVASNSATDSEIQRAIQESIRENEANDYSLQQALAMSASEMSHDAQHDSNAVSLGNVLAMNARETQTDVTTQKQQLKKVAANQKQFEDETEEAANNGSSSESYTETPGELIMNSGVLPSSMASPLPTSFLPSLNKPTSNSQFDATSQTTNTHLNPAPLPHPSSASTDLPSAEEIRKKRKKFLDSLSRKS